MASKNVSTVSVVWNMEIMMKCYPLAALTHIPWKKQYRYNSEGATNIRSWLNLNGQLAALAALVQRVSNAFQISTFSPLEAKSRHTCYAGYMEIDLVFRAPVLSVFCCKKIFNFCNRRDYESLSNHTDEFSKTSHTVPSNNVVISLQKFSFRYFHKNLTSSSREHEERIISRPKVTTTSIWSRRMRKKLSWTTSSSSIFSNFYCRNVLSERLPWKLFVCAVLVYG